MKFSLYISFRQVGQDTASKAAAVINTNRYRQCAETSYADSNVKDDKDSTPQITLTVDSTSINVSPTQQRFRLRGQLKKEKRNFDLFTRKVLSPWRSFRSADSSVGQLIKGFLKSWDIEKSLVCVWFTWRSLRFNSLPGRHENGRH